MRNPKLCDDERFVKALTSCNEISQISISCSGGYKDFYDRDLLTIRNDGLITYTLRSCSELRIKFIAPASEIADAMNALKSLKNVEPDLTIIEDAGIITIKAKCDGNTISMQSCVIPSWMKDFLSRIRVMFNLH